MQRFSLFLLCLIAFLPVSAAEWEHVYGTPGLDESRWIIPTPDGAYLAVGCITPADNAYQFGWALKIDAAGDTIWTKVYRGGRYQEINCVAATPDNGYLAVGNCESNAGDVWVLKLDSHGDTLWTRNFGGTGRELAWSVCPAQAGGYLVAGFTHSYGHGGSDGWVLKLDDAGDTLWTRTYGGSGSDQIRSLVPAPDGGYILAGYSNSRGAGDFDAWIIKINERGDTLWTRTYGSTGSDAALNVSVTLDGNYIVSGFTFSPTDGCTQGWIFKLNLDGTQVWSRTLPGSDASAAWSVAPLSGGGYIVAGSTASFGAGLRDAWIVKLTDSGSLLWDRTFGGMDDDEAYSVVPTPEGGYLSAGYSKSFGVGNEDVYAIKTDAFGTLSVGSFSPSADLGTLNAWSCDGRLELKIDLPKGGDVRLDLFNELGMKVANLVDQALPAGVSRFSIEVPSLPNGIYLIYSDGILPSAKIVISR